MARRPRLLILITLPDLGGAQAYVASLVPGLQDEFDVVVAASGTGPLTSAVEASGARFVPLRYLRRSIHPLYDLLAVAEIRRLCRREQPAIVHANSSKAGVLGRFAAALARVPVRMFTVHGWAFAAYSGFASRAYLWADRLVRPLTTAIVCVAENERREGLAARTCVADRTIVIHNAIDARAAPVAQPDGSPPRLVTVGRFAYPKDFATLVDALGQLGGEWSAAIVGDGPERRDVERRIRDRGLEGRVELLGERRDVPELLASAGVFVLASRSEGFPMSILEAMAAGLPVVASDVGGVAEAVVPGETGSLVPPGDAGALATALGRLVADPEERRRLGEAGRARVLESFGLERFHESHLALYRRELERAAAATAAAARAR